jgi:hypothetical protein
MMDRRGFLGSLMAVTTAIASGVKLPSSREIAVAAPKAVAVQNNILDLLKDCHAISIESFCFVDKPTMFAVEYLHCPGSKKDSNTLMVDQYTKGLSPVTVHLSSKVGELPRVNVTWA